MKVYRDGVVHVAVRKCATCVFRPGNLMDLEPGRVDQMRFDAVKGQGVITCHKTISGEEIGPAVCRGFFDVHKADVGLLEAAERMNVVKEVDVDGTKDE